MRATLLSLLLSVAASAAAAQPAPGTPLPAGTKVLKDLAYVEGGHERQKLDLYLPATGARWPLVVAIHGGAFRAEEDRGIGHDGYSGFPSQRVSRPLRPRASASARAAQSWS